MEGNSPSPFGKLRAAPNLSPQGRGTVLICHDETCPLPILTLSHAILVLPHTILSLPHAILSSPYAILSLPHAILSLPHAILSLSKDAQSSGEPFDTATPLTFRLAQGGGEVKPSSIDRKHKLM